MFKITGLSKAICGCGIFENVTLSAAAGEHVGLTGPSGSGKTVLLRIILGIENWQKGIVAVRPSTWFGYLPQHAIDPGDYSVHDVLETAKLDCYEMRNEADLGWACLHTGSSDYIVTGCSRSSEAVLCSDHWPTGRVQHDIIAGLELRYVAPRYRLRELGLAEQRRVWLAALLLAKPDVLVLDDPTAGLSPLACDWLESHLARHEGTVLLASQDTSFLSRVADKIWRVVPDQHDVVEHRGNRFNAGTERSVLVN